jgi:hypothetical protein
VRLFWSSSLTFTPVDWRKCESDCSVSLECKSDGLLMNVAQLVSRVAQMPAPRIRRDVNLCPRKKSPDHPIFRPGRQVFDHECSQYTPYQSVVNCVSLLWRLGIRRKNEGQKCVFVVSAYPCFVVFLVSYACMFIYYTHILYCKLNRFSAIVWHRRVFKLLPYRQMFLNFGIYIEISISSQVQIFLLSRLNDVDSYV